MTSGPDHSATVEERYLTGQFSEDDPAFTQSTKMFVPFMT